MLLLCLLALALGPGLAAQASPGSTETALQELVVNIPPFDGSALAPRHRPLLVRLHQVLLARLATLPPRPLGPTETDALRRISLTERRRQALRSWETARDRYDTLRLQGSTVAPATLDSARKALEAAEADWKALDPAVGGPGEAKPATGPGGAPGSPGAASPAPGAATPATSAAGTGGGAAAGLLPIRLQAGKDLDRLEPANPGWAAVQTQTGALLQIQGTLSPLGDDHAYLSLRVDHLAEGRLLWEGEVPLALDATTGLPDEVIRPLGAAILGYEAASLQVEGEGFAALASLEALAVDAGTGGTEAARRVAEAGGPNQWPWLPPGTYRLVQRDPLRAAWTQVITLAPGEVVGVLWDDRPLARPSMVLESNVPALVYQGAEPLGTTPLSLDLPPIDGSFYLLAPGYARQSLVLGPMSPPRLRVDLNWEGIGGETWVGVKRDAFYGSFGVALASLAIPIVFDALLSNELQTYALSSLSPAQRAAVAKRGNIYFQLRNGGYVVSAFLFLDTIRRVSEYVAAAEALDSVPGQSIR